uniref:Methyl CpG binding protein 2 (Rett syndrome) [Pelodiscus sinensis] n=1 Tax=Lepeophtheirus salmonis TaxID=72036 RepID=A0A0K2T9I6_LEPSM
MTSVSAKFLQGEHQGRGESSSELQSSVVVVKNNEEDDQKIKSTLNSSKQSSQNPTAFTVHHQPFSHHPSNSSSASYNNNPSSPSSYYYSSFFGKRLEGNSGSLSTSSSCSTSNNSSNNNQLGGGNSGPPSTPLHISSEMQQDFYRPYSLQTSSHLHHHHHGSHSFGPPQPHHIIHHHPNSPSSSQRLLLPPPPPPGCGGGESISSPNSSLSPSVPSFNQSPSSYNQNSTTNSTNNSSTSSANSGGTNNHLYNSTTPSPSSNESTTYQSAGGFIPPETYDRLYRPHPTRPVSGPAMPPPTSTPTSSPNSNAPSVVAAGSSTQGRSQFQRVISSPLGQQQGQASGSVSSSLIMSNFSASSPPGAALSPTPAPATPKFRYPSGPSGASPRTTTPSSTLSSREGTPLPSNSSDSTSVSAPNVDISRVHLDEFFHNNYSPSSSSSSSTPTRGAAAAIKSEFPTAGPPQNCAAPSSAFSTLSHYNSPGFLYGPPPQQFLSNPPQQCITLTQRTVQQMRSKGGLEFTGAPRGRRPGSSNLGPGGSNVKIGRRPAHLPKNLKFDDKTLPPGWVRKLKQRKHGKQAGRWDVYIYSPCGVKFASRKKLKSFFEKNNLNYDPEDFDFTPYGRHLDAAARANTSNSSSGGAGSSSNNKSGGNNNTNNTAAVMSNHNSNNSAGVEMVNSGRHNSSGSTGSEGTHEGSSPASLQNCSPTHPSGGGHLYSNSSSTFGPLGSHLSASGNSEYNYPSFDPLMENPPNASALDVPPPAEIYNHRVPIQPHLKTDNSGAGILSPGYFPMEMAEILGDNSLNGTSSSQQGSTTGESPSLHPHQLHQLHHHHHHIHHGSGPSSSSPGTGALHSFSDLRSRMMGRDGTELEDPSLSASGPPSQCVVSLPSESSLIPISGTNKMGAHLTSPPNNASTSSTTTNTGLGPPVPPEMPPIEKTFSIRNTISLLESGNDPYTTYNEYD